MENRIAKVLLWAALLVGGLCWARSAQAQPVRTFVLGRGGRSWRGGGGGIDPEFLVGPPGRARADTSNAPGGAIEFDQRPGWISALYFDENENIAGRVLLEGGSISAPNTSLQARAVVRRQLRGTVNGDHLSAFEVKPTPFNPEVRARGIWVILDFGIPVGVSRVRFYPRNTVFSAPSKPFQDDFMRGYELFVNERLTNTAANAPDVLVARDPENEEPVVDLEVPPQYARLVKLRSLADVPFEIDEVEVYGTGYLRRGRYLSDLIDLGGRATVGRVRWIEEAVGEPAFSRASVRVRTGSDDTPILYQRRGESEVGTQFVVEVPGAEYYELDRTQRAPLEEDSAHWSPWQAAENGTLVAAPGPRRYIQFRIDFEGDLFATRRFQRLQFEFLQPPIADTLRAEVFPRLARAEEPATFRYAVLLRSAGPIRGYDRLEVDTNIGVENIRALKVNGVPVDFEVETNTPEFFRLAFPLVRADGTLLEFSFDLPIFRFGTTFSGRAFNSRFPQVPQRLAPGNATVFDPEDLDELSNLSVAIPRAQVGRLVGEIALGSRTITPNGDGINDHFEIFFNLLQLTRPTPVALEIYDLSGRRVHTVFEEERRIGPAMYRWDGRRADGGLLPPGNYIWVLRVRADAFEERHHGVIGIVY